MTEIDPGGDEECEVRTYERMVKIIEGFGCLK